MRGGPRRPLTEATPGRLRLRPPLRCDGCGGGSGGRAERRRQGWRRGATTRRRSAKPGAFPPRRARRDGRVQGELPRAIQFVAMTRPQPSDSEPGGWPLADVAGGPAAPSFAGPIRRRTTRPSTSPLLQIVPERTRAAFGVSQRRNGPELTRTAFGPGADAARSDGAATGRRGGDGPGAPETPSARRRPGPSASPDAPAPPGVSPEPPLRPRWR